jgi:GT2 family glycosyltransferase
LEIKDEKGMTSLSIIIPHYEKQQSLIKVLDELKIQISSEDRIYIIDDFSSSGVPDLNCNCTRIIHPPEKLTPHIYRLNTLRNLGIASAKNDAVVILDPDCVPNPHFIENARKIFDPSVLHGGRIDYIQKDGSLSLDPRTLDKESGWIDDQPRHGGGGLVWGGCMMFSRSRTSLIGWFDTDFDGRWGAEEHEFASRCFHSGMRLHYSKELLVTHLYHEKHRFDPEGNITLWGRKVFEHSKHLNITTNYRPAVGICVITMLRSELIDQCLRAIFRNIIPLKVRLCVNGDTSEKTKRALRPWVDKWAVEVVMQERVSPTKIRNEAMQWARNKGYKYLVTVDDDVTVSANGITNLIRVMEDNPSIYACAGYLRDIKGKEIMLGGPIIDNRFNYFSKQTGIHDVSWVGSGFTICRLEDVVLYDEKYEMGWEDPDWCMEILKRGKRIAVCGDAGAYHKAFFTNKGLIENVDIYDYKVIRYDSLRHERMSNLFQSKWGFSPRMGPVINVGDEQI